ncbi:MAG TPA: tripartite tricarboxylate transporter substrate binding protein [Burkholderiales bacterium]|nr:tripartite tricarboxylate transporter substrate binding protein [Burkholderiales bacterium]
MARALLFFLVALQATAALAQSYPTKPVRILLGFPVGQATDILARIVATRLSAQHGQQFYVDNRPGAAGIIATELAAKAEPDGYTLLATSSGPLAVNPSLYAKLPYDVARDFVVVAGLGIVPYAVVVSANSPFKDIKGLVAYAKANPGKLNYASGGSGVTNHLVTEMFKATAGIDMQHVPYKGGPAALTDLLGGQVDVMFETMVATLSLVKSGKLRALAVSSAERASAVPELPTISESGYPGFTGVPWVAMAAPIRTPKAIVASLNADINRILSQPEVRESFIAQGSEPMVKGLAEMDEFVKAETLKWGRAVKASGAKVD